jgi:DNA-binding CsgD family transcriptional regulator
VVISQSICSNKELLASEFYNDWLRPQGNLLHGLNCTLDAKESSLAFATYLRSEVDGAFKPEESNIFQIVFPHLQRAIQLEQRLSALEMTKDAAVSVLDRWTTGVVLFNSHGKVILMNRTAQTIIAEKDGLILERRQLRAAFPKESSTLARLIDGAIQQAERRAGEPGGMLLVSRPLSKRRPLHLLVTPIRVRDGLFLLTKPAAAAFITDPESDLVIDVERLRQLFHLTPAEARLAVLLAEGKALKEAAQSQGILISTARTHLQRIFQKTETKRQTELIRLIVGGLTNVRED